MQLTAGEGKYPQTIDVSAAKLHVADAARNVCRKAVQLVGKKEV